MELISVIIPTYNRAGMLRRSVESVRQQTWENIEILIVDDASADETQSVCDELCREDGRIRYIKLDQNGGAARARNEGARNADGEWIAFQDSDDYWQPEKLKAQMTYALCHPEYGMIYCPFVARTETETGRYPREDMTDLEGDLFGTLLRRNTIGTPTMLLKRELFEQTGGFDTTFRSLEDWEFVLRFSRQWKIGYLNEVLVEADYKSAGRLSIDAGSYYESRLNMVIRYRKELTEHGIFDEVLMEIFDKASGQNCLEIVKDMFLVMLRKAQ